MRFSRVPIIIATLTAASLLALTALPALAGDGNKTVTGTPGFDDNGNLLPTHVLTARIGSIETDIADLVDDPTDAANEDGVLFVSNRGDNAGSYPGSTLSPATTRPLNRVTVAYVPASETTVANNPSDGVTIEKKVRASSGHEVTLPCRTNTREYEGRNTFKVVPRDGTPPADDCDLQARHGDTITISVAGVSLQVEVDGQGPRIHDIFPADGFLTNDDRFDIGFTVTDMDSGLRSEREDHDTRTGRLPLYENASDEVPQDIHAFIEQARNTVNNFGRSPLGGDGQRNGWDEEIPGKSYSLDVRQAQDAFGGPLRDGANRWWVWARDRVGNITVTQAVSGGRRDFFVIVDNQDPTMADGVFAGIGFDGDETNDNSSILVQFKNSEGAETGGDLDALDAASLDASDFEVEDNTVVGIIHPNIKRSVQSTTVTVPLVVTIELNEEGEYIVPSGSVMVGATVTASNEDINSPVSYVQRGTSTMPNPNAMGTEDVVLEANDIVIGNGDDALIAYLRGIADARAEGMTTTETTRTCASGEGKIRDLSPDSNYASCIDTRNRVYLQLAEPLANDATPEVSIVGEIADRAGNVIDKEGPEKAEDRIAPSLDVTITSDVSTSGRTMAREKITVSVAASEVLASEPMVWLVDFDAEGNVDGAPAPRTLEPDGDGWTVSISHSGDPKVSAVLVYAEDDSDAQNVTATRGWKGASEDGPEDTSLDLVKVDAAGYLVEFDNSLAAATWTLDPAAEGATDVTESASPFITLTFGAESTENAKRDGSTSYTDGDDRVKFNAYDDVELTSAMLNGADVLDAVSQIRNDYTYSVALSGLADGDHELEYTAVDQAGNTRTATVEFEKRPRSPYEIDLRPGWNLVSLPANPLDTSLDAVLPAGNDTSTVLSYQNSEWVSASRDSNGEWVGTLFSMEAGYGYFVEAGGFTTLEAAIPESNPTSLFPTVPVVQGWNLLGVIDTDQASAGSQVSLSNAYFSSINWTIAYSYNPRDGRPEKITSADEDEPVYAGRGYWVWVTSAGTLVP